MRKVQILGTGCAKCQTLYDNARRAADESGVPCEVVKVTAIVEMLSFHAIGLPALASGKVLTAEDMSLPETARERSE